ncbi:hypothetical protein P3T24_006608 [Paraburkholderia sp. GAS33]
MEAVTGPIVVEREDLTKIAHTLPGACGNESEPSWILNLSRRQRSNRGQLKYLSGQLGSRYSLVDSREAYRHVGDLEGPLPSVANCISWGSRSDSVRRREAVRRRCYVLALCCEGSCFMVKVSVEVSRIGEGNEPRREAQPRKARTLRHFRSICGHAVCSVSCPSNPIRTPGSNHRCLPS